MIKIKKLLTSLAAIGLVASTSSMVVSCGPSFSSLRNRKIDTSVYKTTFNNNIQNWNMAATMQSADFKILANTQDTLMTYDKDGNIVPLLADAKTEDEGLTWTITIQDNAKWFDFRGNVVGDIKAKDIKNTYDYDMNSENGSELASDWKVFVKDIKVDNDKQLTITLKNPAPYFESVLSTGSFSPTPDEAIKLGKDYGRGINYENTLLTGPYYVDSYKNSYELVLKRNKNYKLDGHQGTVDTIKYFYTQNNDVANNRRLFETGDITEAPILPSDSYGYKHYVNKFNGLQVVPNNLIGAKYLWFNFSKQHGNGDIKQEDKDSNEALSYNSVRTLIDYEMNRATLVKYFAGDEKNIKDYLTNTFNQVGGDEYAKKIFGEDYVAKDMFYQNEKLLTESGYKDMNDLIKKVNENLGNKKVTLTFLTSGVNAKTFNPYIKKMLNDFNNIENNPIKIIEQPTADDSAYQQAQLDGNYSMFITGETPTYMDPMSFLVNLNSNGPMSLYDGMKRLFDETGKEITGAANKYGLKGDVISDITDYTTRLNTVAPADETTRQTAFANIEKDILLKDKTILPLYKPNGKYTYNLTYIDYTTRPNYGFGYQDYRLNKVKLYETVQKLIDSGNLHPEIDKNDNAIVKQN